MVLKTYIRKSYLFSVILLASFGFIIFLSASLAFYDNIDVLSVIILKQILLGYVGGMIAFLIALKSNLDFWRRSSVILLIIGIVLMILVFVPGVARDSHAGAQRWINIFGLSFQPVEFLKIGYILFLASYVSAFRRNFQSFKYILPVIAVLGFIFILLEFQNDHKHMAILLIVTGVLLFYGGMKVKQALIILLAVTAVMGIVVALNPYLQQRLLTFINPSHDPLGASFQVGASKRAIEQGGLTGTGLGFSNDKAGILPEAHGDAIFAVLGEELGFIGASGLVVLYTWLFVEMMKISSLASTLFGRHLTVAFAIIFISQAYWHIGGNLGLLPFTGIPLPLVSQGGSAVLVTAFMLGLVGNVSRKKIY